MPIRCPACTAENSDQARFCGSCNVKLPRKSRRRRDEEPPPATGWGPFAYRCSVWGLIPLVGALKNVAEMVRGGDFIPDRSPAPDSAPPIAPPVPKKS